MKYNGTFFFDPEDKIYKDHFPGNPIVPGSLILHAFMEAGKKMVPASFSAEKFRFKTFIPPGAYSYSVDQQENRLKCKLCHGNKTVVTGTLNIV